MATKKDTETSDGKISRRKLLQLTGEFDVESVHFIQLSNMNLKDLTVLSECKNITRLDVSRNKLSTIEPVRQLKSIVFLNISVNQITNIDCLAGLEGLEELLAAGNLLSNVERIKCLMGVLTLRKLRLKDNIKSLTNPLCEMENYQKSVLKLFPSLVVFDGERVKGRGSELYKLCCELDEQIESGRTFGPVSERPLAEPWTKPGYFTFNQPPVTDDESTRKFAELLKDCKKVADHSSVRLEKFKSMNVKV